MTKKKKEKLKLIISKKSGWLNHKILINLGKERDELFNKGEKVEVTKEELKTIGKHRWLEVESGS